MSFESAALHVTSLMEAGMRVSETNMLELYKYYKQSKDGDIPADKSRPAFYDMKGQRKHNAWASVRGTSKEVARAKYVETVDRISTEAVSST